MSITDSVGFSPQVSDVTFAHFHALLDCHLIVMTVNSNDTKSCCAKLAEVVTNPKQMPIFSLQRGVRNSTIVKEEYVPALPADSYNPIMHNILRYRFLSADWRARASL